MFLFNFLALSLRNSCINDTDNIIMLCRLYKAYLIIRLTSWNEAQSHCESHNTTLLQYTDQVDTYGLKFWDFPEDHEFSQVMFLGLKRNTQVYATSFSNTIIKYK